MLKPNPKTGGKTYQHVNVSIRGRWGEYHINLVEFGSGSAPNKFNYCKKYYC